MKKFIYLFILFLILPTYVNALDVDANRRGSIKINYSYAGKDIYGSNVSIYRVASIDDNGKFIYLNQYDLDDSLEIDSASKWNDLAIKIKNYIDDKSIGFLKSCDIKKDNVCEFTDLEVGLYLIASTDVKQDGYQYSSSPTLIAIPNQNAMDSSFIYEVNAFLKVSAKAINVDNNTINVPKTIDDIYTYVIVSIISIIAMVIVVFYINKLRKKEKKK